MHIKSKHIYLNIFYSRINSYFKVDAFKIKKLIITKKILILMFLNLDYFFKLDSICFYSSTKY